MGVQLNIKDAKTVELARALAKRSGKSVTETIKSALEQQAAAQDQAITERRQQIDRLLADIHADLPGDLRGKSSREIMDSIYDDAEPDGFAR